MKRKTAKELLADSFLELAETVSVDKIKIKDITDNCSYSPATFYRQYKDKTDLIVFAYKRDFDEIIDNMSSSKATLESLVLAVALYFMNNRDYYKGILVSEKANDCFIKPMIDFHFEMVKSYCMEHGKSSLTIEDEMVLRAFVVGSLSVIFDWIVGIWDTSPEELAHTCVKALPSEFFSLAG